MTKAQRKKQIRMRVAMFVIAMVSVVAILKYANDCKGKGKYKVLDSMVYADGREHVIYSIGSVYNGNDIFEDTNGNEWEYDGFFTEGKRYRLIINNNGTTEIEDDIIIDIR